MKWNWIIALLIFAACQTEVEPPAESTQAEAYTPSTSAEGAAVYIITPEDGSVVQSGAVTVKFGLSGMGVAPAGIEFDNSGHHHLLVNAEQLPPMDMPIPTDSVHLHFGLGQTETTLDLSPGTYTLQLVLGDYAHIPHDPPVVSEPVTITVE
ncbi:MAG: DUF4399 domain-containing protein [Rhodothermaceae bacterium]|nr:DUF4399 domain-containing protein [Rhodothermaceae bacterium]MYF40354.1 DUF4399 domain-containing protein [Rhodothermaceae bacterium]